MYKSSLDKLYKGVQEDPDRLLKELSEWLEEKRGRPLEMADRAVFWIIKREVESDK